MKTRNHLLSSLLILLVIGCGMRIAKPADSKTNKVEASLQDKSQELAGAAFQAGLFLGYAACQNGATKEDIRYILECYQSNRIDLVTKWISDHPYKAK